jgi:hypothetical protein
MDGGVVLFSLTNLLYNRVCNFSRRNLNLKARISSEVISRFFSIDKEGKEDYNTIKPTNHVGLQEIWFVSE